MKNWLFGKEPALIIGVVSALLSLLAGLGLKGLGGDTVGLIVALISALLGAAQAYYTRPIAPAAFSAAVAAGAALAVSYGLHLDPAVIGGVNALIITVMAMMTRHQVSPLSQPTAGTLSASPTTDVPPVV